MDKSSIRPLALFAASLLFVSVARAELRELQTTRLLSTAGTGVGSILMDEATILNPAPLAFFTVTSFYVQKNKGNFENEKAPGETTSTTEKLDNWSFIASDANGNMGASFSYEAQKSGPDKRKRMSLSVGTPADKTSALGFTVRRTVDQVRQADLQMKESTKYQFVVGVSHAISPSFTLGLVAIDPTKRVAGETRVLAGLQYVYEEFIALMFDGGTDYTQSFSSSAQYRGAIQFKVFSDFYLRVGAFEDKAKHERGNGGGVGWVSPKLVFEAAIGRKRLLAYEHKREKTQDAKETSFSLSYRF